MNEALAIIIGYLLGSIPAAFIITRLVKGQDIRRIGGGNVGGLNVFREVGLWPALAVGVVDFGKGAAAVAIAKWGLNVPDAYVLLAGLASVIGHNWMVWLKFSGGKGMGTTMGALLVLLPVYGYSLQLGIFFGIIIIPLLITRNVAMSMFLGLAALPILVWFATHSGYATIISVVLLLIIMVKFLPTAIAALRKSGAAALGVDRWRRDKS
ncbi:MAG: glycerol-3-phosphate acyltransferase [Chloroflexota bacterium]